MSSREFNIFQLKTNDESLTVDFKLDLAIYFRACASAWTAVVLILQSNFSRWFPLLSLLALVVEQTEQILFKSRFRVCFWIRSVPDHHQTRGTGLLQNRRRIHVARGWRGEYPTVMHVEHARFENLCFEREPDGFARLHSNLAALLANPHKGCRILRGSSRRVWTNHGRKLRRMFPQSFLVFSRRGISPMKTGNEKQKPKCLKCEICKKIPMKMH